MKNFKKLVPQPFKKKIIVICGQLHSGKSFLNKLVCSLGETNFPSFDYNFEYLLDLYKLKKISYVDFKSIFEFYLNTILVNKNLGRYVNLRKGDDISKIQMFILKNVDRLINTRPKGNADVVQTKAVGNLKAKLEGGQSAGIRSRNFLNTVLLP